MINQLISSTPVPFEVYAKADKFVLFSVTPAFRYVDGKATEQIEAYRYTIGDPTTCMRFSVKVPGATAIITPEQLKVAKEPILVTLTDAFGRIYQTDGNVEISFSAKGIAICK